MKKALCILMVVFLCMGSAAMTVVLGTAGAEAILYNLPIADADETDYATTNTALMSSHLANKTTSAIGSAQIAESSAAEGDYVLRFGNGGTRTAGTSSYGRIQTTEFSVDAPLAVDYRVRFPAAVDSEYLMMGLSLRNPSTNKQAQLVQFRTHSEQTGNPAFTDGSGIAMYRRIGGSVAQQYGGSYTFWPNRETWYNMRVVFVPTYDDDNILQNYETYYYVNGNYLGWTKLSYNSDQNLRKGSKAVLYFDGTTKHNAGTTVDGVATGTAYYVDFDDIKIWTADSLSFSMTQTEDIEPLGTLEATFSHDIQASTVTASSILIKDEDDNTIEVASVTQDSENPNKISFTTVQSLRPNHQYTVSFPGIKSVLNFASSQTQTFTTAESDTPLLSLTRPIFVSGTDVSVEENVLSSLQNGTISCEIKYTNQDYASACVTQIMALYKGDRLVKTVSSPATSVPAGSASYSVVTTMEGIEMETGTETTYKLKVFVWEDFSSFRPLTNAFEL